MEKVNIGQSTKNIPVPPTRTYLQMMISKMEKVVHNMRWKAFFYLKPEEKPNSKENFGFKSTNPAPSVPELRNFEMELINLSKNLKFGKRTSHFQQNLKKEVSSIKASTKPLIKADKSTNFYKMDPNKYNSLVEKEIQKEYKKISPSEIESVKH